MALSGDVLHGNPRVSQHSQGPSETYPDREKGKCVDSYPCSAPSTLVPQANGLTLLYTMTHIQVLKQLSILWQWKGKDKMH